MMTPEPIAKYGTVSLREELKQQVANLEAMFADPGLQALRDEHPDHPAVARHRTLKQLVEREGGFDAREEADTATTLAAAMLDRSTWAIDPEADDYWAFIPDESGRDFIRSRIRLPAFFEDVVTELFFWGWLRYEGMEVRLGEDEGTPDLHIRTPTRPVWAEVKRIHVGTTPSRMRKVISKANEQIKNVDLDDGGGIALVHVDRLGVRASLDDRVPSDVQPFIDEARRALGSNTSKSVGHVVITWDDLLVHSGPDAPTLYAVRRRSLVLEHANPRARPAVESSALSIGRTATLWARYSDRPRAPLEKIDAGDVVVTQMFRQQNEFAHGVRPGHVAEAVADPDALVRYELDKNYEVLLATRRVDSGRRPFVLLVVAHQRPGARPEVTAGYKLFGDDTHIQAMTDHPAFAFRTLITRFARPIRVGRQVGLFIPKEVVHEDESGATLIQGLGDVPANLSTEAVVRRSQTEGTFDVQWAFALDVTEYRRTLRYAHPPSGSGPWPRPRSPRPDRSASR